MSENIAKQRHSWMILQAESAARPTGEKATSQKGSKVAVDVNALTKQVSTDSAIRRKSIREHRQEEAAASSGKLWNITQNKEKEKKKVKREDSENSVHSEKLTPAKRLVE